MSWQLELLLRKWDKINKAYGYSFLTKSLNKRNKEEFP